jgi:hypothetical protein
MILIAQLRAWELLPRKGMALSRTEPNLHEPSPSSGDDRHISRRMAPSIAVSCAYNAARSAMEHGSVWCGAKLND